MSNIKDAFLGGGAGIVAIDGLWSSIDVVFAFADLVYVPMSVAFGTLVPNVDFISQETLQPVMVFVALLYVSNLLITRIQRYRSENSDD